MNVGNLTSFKDMIQDDYLVHLKKEDERHDWYVPTATGKIMLGSWAVYALRYDRHMGVAHAIFEDVEETTQEFSIPEGVSCFIKNVIH